MAMRHVRTFHLVWLGLVLGPIATAPAAPPEGDLLRPQIELQKSKRGVPTVVIHFPWKAFTKPSVEMAIWTDKGGYGERLLLPTRFVATQMKNEWLVAVDRAREEARQMAVHRTLTAFERTVDLLADKTELGKPAVSLVIPPRQPDEEAVAKIADRDLRLKEMFAGRTHQFIFPFLQDWAWNDRTLWLELPPKFSAKPGTLHVWFLRDNEPIWSEAIAWPGAGK